MIKRAALVLIAIFVVYYGMKVLGKFENVPSDENLQIGAKFELKNQNSKLITDKDLNGKYSIVLFGFSRCPHICPNQLAMLSKSLDEYKNLQAFFISVDPQNDTVEKLKEFHENFHPRIQMLTGDQKVTDDLIKGYKIYIQRDDDPEKFNHSTIMYLMGTKGEYIAHFVPGDEDELHHDLKKYIG